MTFISLYPGELDGGLSRLMSRGRSFIRFFFQLEVTVGLLEAAALLALDLPFEAADARHAVFLGASGEGGDFGRWQNGGPNEDDEFVADFFVRRAAEEIPQDGNIFEERNAGAAPGFRGFDQTTKNDGVVIANRNFGRSFFAAGDRDIPDVGDRDSAIGAFNGLMNIHDDEAIGIDQGSDFEGDTYVHRLDGGITADGAAAVITGARVWARFTDEQLGLLIVRGLNPWPLKDAGAAVAGDQIHGDVEVAAKTAEITEAAGEARGGIRGGAGNEVVERERGAIVDRADAIEIAANAMSLFFGVAHANVTTVIEGDFNDDGFDEDLGEDDI